MLTSFRAYSRNRLASVQAQFIDPQSPPTGPAVIPEDWTYIMQRNYVLFMKIFENRSTLVLAYRSLLYGDYTVNGPSLPPTAIDTYRQILSFRSVFETVTQIETPESAAELLEITLSDNWPDVLVGSSVDYWTPFPQTLCLSECSMLATTLGYTPLLYT